MIRTTLKGLFAHKLRLLLTGLSILIGVGFVAGTFIFSDQITETFDNLFADAYEGTDVVVESDPEFTPFGAEAPPFDESLLETVQAVDGVAVAEGFVTGYAQLIDKNGDVIAPLGAPAMGMSWAVDEALWGAVSLREGNPPERGGEMTVDARTAEDNNIVVGDVLDVLVPTGKIQAEVVGITGFGDADNLAGATVAAFELREAQRVMGFEGQLHQISVVAASGVDDVALRDHIAGVLPEGMRAATGDDQAADQSETLADALGFITIVLLVFAGVAVFVAAFIIQNTFRIIVAQRTRELGLMRAVGATGGQVLRMVIIEAIAVAIVASLLGIGFGLLIAQGISGLMAVMGIELPSTTTGIALRTVIVSLTVGLVVTAAAAIVPARRAARVPPVAAIQDVDLRARSSLRRRSLIGGITLTIGVALMVLAAFDLVEFGVPALAVIGIGAMVVFIGVSTISVVFVKPIALSLAAPVVKLGKVTGLLARENSVRKPRRTAATASALMIGLALVGFFYVLGNSITTATTDAIEQGVNAEFIVTPTGLGAPGFSPELAADIAAQPEVESVTSTRLGFWDYNGSDQLLTGIDAMTAGETFDLEMREGSVVALAEGGLLVAARRADDEGLAVGDTVTMGFAATGRVETPVVGIFEIESDSDWIVGLDLFEANTTQQLDMEIYVNAAPDVAATDVRAAIDAAALTYPNAEVRDMAEYREEIQAQVDGMLVLFQGLLFLAVLIALLGITNTLVLSIHERTREIGLLRAVGMSRWQIRRMVIWESLIVSVMGGLLGIAVGIGFGALVVSSIEGLGFDTITIPTGQILGLVVVAAIAGLIASIAPARRAARLNILDAIAYE